VEDLENIKAAEEKIAAEQKKNQKEIIETPKVTESKDESIEKTESD